MSAPVTIKLYEFPAAFGMATYSPFGLKLEAYMHLGKIPYERVYEINPRKGPKEKIPFIIDGDVKMGDSQLILEHLIKTRGDEVDAHLSPEERVQGHCIRRMVEEGLYFVNVYQRWVDDDGWALVGPQFLASVPPLLRATAAPFVRAGVRKHLWGQGIARHTPDEIAAMGEADVRALALLLGDKPFFLGDRPASVDASVYGITHGMHQIPLDEPVSALIRDLPNLVAYDQRMTRLVFGDEKF
jgi:glutathione S-transferase